MKSAFNCRLSFVSRFDGFLTTIQSKVKLSEGSAFIDQDALASSHCMSKDCTGEQLLFQDLDTAIADLRSDVDCFFLRYVPCPVPT